MKEYINIKDIKNTHDLINALEKSGLIVVCKDCGVILPGYFIPSSHECNGVECETVILRVDD